MMFIASLLTLLTPQFFSSAALAEDLWNKRGSAGIAPQPDMEKRAVVLIYGARTWGWRGTFAIHTWISYKRNDENTYHVAQVIGWRKYHGLPVLRVEPDYPDRYWFGAQPNQIFELRGKKAELAIPKIESALKSYPYANSYRVWPGPNSNTFTAHVIREVSELNVELPPHAIGKDWLNHGMPVGISQTGTGFQPSLFGLLGVTLGLRDGIEINILGLSFGIDFLRPALKLPLVGRLGLSDQTPTTSHQINAD